MADSTGITRYQKVFGVGPLVALIGAVLLGFLLILDIALGHVEISIRAYTVRIIGCMLFVLWICWHSWSMYTIRRWWMYDRLCTTGPYRFVRHPIYAGAVFVALTPALIWNSWILLLLPALMYAAYSILVHKEEAMMMSIFGEEYKKYAARTGRFFPRPRPEKMKS